MKSGNSKPAKKELMLDILATVLLDALALAGIILVIPYAQDDSVGTIAVMLIFVVLGASYTGIVIGEDLVEPKRK